MGDFLGCGTEQILVVFKDQGVTGQPLEKFLLTDLCGITFAVRNHFLYQLDSSMSYMYIAEGLN